MLGQNILMEEVSSHVAPVSTHGAYLKSVALLITASCKICGPARMSLYTQTVHTEDQMSTAYCLLCIFQKTVLHSDFSLLTSTKHPLAVQVC